MSDFSDLRDRLTKSRADRDRAARDLAQRREEAKRIDRELAALRCVGDDRVQELEGRMRELAAELSRSRDAFAGLRAGTSEILGALAALADPTKQIAELSDSIPILLFPVRL